jgi:hypothetical protein
MNYSINFIVAAIIGGLAIRIVMHFVDKSRIKDEIESKGGRVISIAWNPFARGWFFEKGERHYEVSYVDRSGGTISTTCKTSLFTGIYWAEGAELGRTEASIHGAPSLFRVWLCIECRVARLSKLRQSYQNAPRIIKT